MEQPNRPRTGIGVMIIRGDKVLLGQRQGSHGAGEYAFPGGHLEHLESFADCARREVREECGLEINNIRFLLLANLKQYAPKHYVHITLLADAPAGEPRVLEPEKCVSWEWYDLDKLPQPLFLACRISVDSYRTGKNYYDDEDFSQIKTQRL